MARSDLTPIAPLGPFADYDADDANVTPEATTGSAGDSGDQFVASGDDLVIVEETAGAPQTILFSSVDCPHGRTGDIGAYTLGANEFAVFGAFNVIGWRQTDNKIYLESNSANIKVVVIALP